MTLLVNLPLISNSDVGDPNSLWQKHIIAVSTAQLEYERRGRVFSVGTQQCSRHCQDHQKPCHGAVGISTMLQGYLH
jgi:hypothetical protein